MEDNLQNPKIMNERTAKILFWLGVLILIIAIGEICNAATVDPNIVNIQFHGSMDRFIVIEERSPRQRIYRSADPNLAADFSFYVDWEKHYILNSQAAFGYYIDHLPFFMEAGTLMVNFDILSRFWQTDKPVIDPNTLVIVNPVWIRDTGTKYHEESCRWAAGAIRISRDEAIKRGLTACSLCNPYHDEPNEAEIENPKRDASATLEPNEPTLAEVLAGVNDPNLEAAILEMMEGNK